MFKFIILELSIRYLQKILILVRFAYEFIKSETQSKRNDVIDFALKMEILNKVIEILLYLLECVDFYLWY